MSANLGSLSHTNGSAVVRIGDTAAVCGVRAEILHTEDIASWGVSTTSGSRKRRKIISDEDNDKQERGNEDEDDEDDYIRNLNLIVPNLSLSTGCAPGFIPSAPPSALAQALSHQMLNMLHTTRLIRSEDLQIWHNPPDLNALAKEEQGEDAMDTESADQLSSPEPEIKGFWVLYIDVMMISLAGNPFDAVWASVVAALQDTKLPKAWWDIDNDMVLCSDKISESRRLNLRGFPVSCSYSVFEADAASDWRAVAIPDADESGSSQQTSRQPERWILADPDGFEESLCRERVYLVVDEEKGGKIKILAMEKNGGISVGREELRKLVETSMQRWKHMKGIYDALH